MSANLSKLSAFILLSCMLVSFNFIDPPEASAQAEEAFKSLKLKLVSDGFKQKKIDTIYNNPKTKFSPKGVSAFFIYSESKLNYDQFASKTSIKKARKYMKAHAKELDNTEKQYGVDKTVITAIILVETRLGTYVGKSSTLNTLSTIASLSQKSARNRLWNSISKSRRISREKFDIKAKKKARWAYKELKALLTFSEKENLDPLSIKGSFAGAIGISQFMPSNILTLAKDGNNDGSIDLFTHADAIASIANYLKQNGWKPGISRKKAHKVLYSYNHSNYYVDTLLKISDLLKG